MKHRPTPLALSLNLTVRISPMMGMVAYLEAGGPTAVRYLRIQQMGPQGYVLE
jgi:hypothetical protein